MSIHHTNTARPKSSDLFQNPVFLLLVTGTLIGFNFPLGKFASDVQISPMMWAMVVSLGAAAMLLPILIRKQCLSVPKGRVLRYVVVSAIISFIAPNVLLFSVIPYVGSGYTGLMFALSPVFTLTLAGLFRLKGPRVLGITGIMFGLAGAMIVTFTRGLAPEAPPMLWIVAALSIPLLLACGNVYRTLDWPPQVAPDVLAFWSHAFAVIVFLGLLFITTGTVPVLELTRAPWAAMSQAVVAGLTFPFFFRLQQHGGPVLLSQIGYIAAAVGLLAATLVFGEQYGRMTWIGAGVIGSGIVLTVVAQKIESRAAT